MIRRLAQISVERPISVLMVTIAILVFGAVGFFRLPVTLLPSLSYPTLTVQTELADAAPAEVENLVTKPVEEGVGVLKGLRSMHSVSRAGLSEVTLEFGWDASMDDLLIDVREKLDRVILPDEALAPVVLRFDPALDPIMRLSLQGNQDLRSLRVIAERQLKDEFSRIEGVASAQVKGGEEEEIQIQVDQGRMAAMGIGFDQIAELVSGSNINRPGGSLEGRDSQYLVRTVNEFAQVEQIGELIITPASQAPVRLSEVATILRGVADREEITTYNGSECVMLDIYKEGDANTVQVAEAVRAALERLAPTLGKGVNLEVLYDQSRFIHQSIREVRSALSSGGVLAILVLLAFLRRLRPTLIVAITIPISVVGTFMVMYRLDVSLNLMSLGGLTLGIGMLVDAAIVVLESIQRWRDQGLSWAAAAIEGTSEVGAAVVASVLTTVAVFLPIVYVEGIAGQLFKDQAITVTISLLASLLAALSLIPMLASLGSKKAIPTSRADLDNETLGWFSLAYQRLLEWALVRRHLILLAFMALCLWSVSSILGRGRELMPPLTQGEFFVEVSLPEGTSLPATARLVREMEAYAAAQPGVAAVYSTAGSRTVAGGLSLKTRDENLGQINVVLRNRGAEQAESEVVERLRQHFSRLPNLSFSVGRPSFFNLKTPIELHFYGEDLVQLQEYTDHLSSRLATLPGLADLRSSLASGNPELTILFRREELAALGLNIRQVSTNLGQRIQGRVISQFKEEDRQIDIRLRNRLQDRTTIADIENLVVAHISGQPITLKAVADVAPARGPAEIHRIRQSRVALIQAELRGASLDATHAAIEGVLAEMPPPIGIDWAWGGQDEEMQSSFRSLLFAMILAVFLVYLVMAATFENLIHPLLILFTVPFAAIGVALGLHLGHLNLSVMGLIGAIFLVGVVVNNAIVLVDAVNQNRRRGMELDAAILTACSVRLRPILMTTLTTVLGLVPMALGFGEGAELRQPLALIVCSGLIVGTLLTLVLIPCLYRLLPSRLATSAEQGQLLAELQAAQTLMHGTSPVAGGSHDPA